MQKRKIWLHRLEIATVSNMSELWLRWVLIPCSDKFNIPRHEIFFSKNNAFCFENFARMFSLLSQIKIYANFRCCLKNRINISAKAVIIVSNNQHLYTNHYIIILFHLIHLIGKKGLKFDGACQIPFWDKNMK